MNTPDTHLTFTLPFQLPFDIPFVHKDKLSSTTTITVQKSYLQFFVRLIVIFCTFLLFRPHLVRLYRTMLGKPDPEAEEISRRIQKIEEERRAASSGGGKKVVAVSGAKGDARAETKPETPSSGKGSTRRRKA